ncbi:MerR-like helix-turn-helix DNA binding domain protein [Arthrobacter phage Sonali]|uniref:MerR-like helix-turn-helix DNA binding domain protein n=1 Tax=Arthrobacter phage Sonali TaxID=2510495 RepID=A0A411CQK5_9CAUD|nr:DNA binding protein [Arthrobacter phage Sonali]QAY16205.1 MerR-like helix-turn-helix DNA binding domain protein [Arthrobacter phage Sonali]
MGVAMIGVMSKPKLMGYQEVAERIGVDIRAVRTYLAKARAHRAAGAPRPGDLPEPDFTIGKSPAWEARTIEAWLKKRPGRGAGGGTKRR